MMETVHLNCSYQASLDIVSQMTNLKALSVLVEVEDKMTGETDIANMIVNLNKLEKFKF